MKRSKYFEINYIMGGRCDFNDPISTGRSLKWCYSCTSQLEKFAEENFKKKAVRLLQVPMVKNVKKGRGWIRVYV